MGVDYYNILKVNRSANEDDLRKAYKRLAMIWHPDKNPPWKRQEAEAKFKQISEAYDVLTDPQKRQIYDSFGEETLKSGQVPPSRGPQFQNQKHTYQTQPSPSVPPSSFRFKPRDADEIYAEIFESEPTENGGGGSGGSGTNLFAERKKAAAITNVLRCSLEELYTGTTKKLKMERTVYACTGSWRLTQVQELLLIEIKPGWKKGTKITFPSKGNEGPGIIPADVVFVIEEKPHATYKRDNNDLVVNQEITLLESLTGKTIHLISIDGRNITIPLTGITRPGAEIIIPNEGMPLPKNPEKKGNLRLKINVRYPSALTPEQKSNLTQVLAGVL